MLQKQQSWIITYNLNGVDFIETESFARRRIQATTIYSVCVGCGNRNLVMPFLVDKQVIYLCRECMNKEYDQFPEFENKRSLPFCVFCTSHERDILGYNFHKELKKWQVTDNVESKRVIVQECDNFGDFIFQALQKNTSVYIYQDKQKKSYYSVFVNR